MIETEEEVLYFLEHHGVKGMHWGVITEEQRSGRKTGAKQDSKEAQRYSKHLEAKYGKDSLSGGGSSGSKEDYDFRLTPAEKKALIAAGIIVGAGVLAAGAVLYFRSGGKYPKVMPFVPIELDAEKFVRGLEFSYSDLKMPDHAAVTLKNGSIIQRMSTIKETSIRPDGFYGAFDPGDVRRYEAALPKYWKAWGYKETSGYLTQIKASKGVKAPSSKESLDIYKKIIDADGSFDQNIRFRAMGDHVTLSPSQRERALDVIAKQTFIPFVGTMSNDGAKLVPQVQSFFKEAQSRGFNAMIDFNDVNYISKSPLRISGKDFQIVGNKAVSEAAILKAQKETGLTFGIGGLPVFPEGTFNVAAAVAAMSSLQEKWAPMDVDEFLEHHGVKGMHWGIRNDFRRNPNTGIRPAAQKLNDSRLGKASKVNVQRHNDRVSARNARTPEQKKARNKKIAIGVGAAAVVVGSVAAAHYLEVHGEEKWVAAQSLKTAKAMAQHKQASEFISASARIKMSKIHNAAARLEISPDQRNRLVALLSRDTSNAYKRADQAFNKKAYGL